MVLMMILIGHDICLFWCVVGEKDALVLCRIFEKSGAGPKNGEKYGAPLIEEEWDNYDLAPLLSTGDPASDEALALDPTNFLEMDDLDKVCVLFYLNR